MRERGALSFALQAIAATLVFMFFESLPHFAVGVSEVRFVPGSMLFLLFGAAAAAFGLALGLLLENILFVPADLPQFGMNATTLLAAAVCDPGARQSAHPVQHRASRSAVQQSACPLDGVSVWYRCLRHVLGPLRRGLRRRQSL
uniref:energy-coupling factor ABC transporter permease n=1 Tax=Rhizobium lupini TaxID=136996 RepID=UPI003F64D104